MPTWRARLRRKVYAKLPQWLKSHDFEVFSATLAILGGLPLVLGQVKPGSPEELLPQALIIVWGLVLTLGGCLTLVGVVLSSYRPYPDRAFWMRMEALGLTSLAYFCYLYDLCLWVVNFRATWTASAIILAFGVICHVRRVSVIMELEGFRWGLGLDSKVGR